MTTIDLNGVLSEVFEQDIGALPRRQQRALREDFADMVGTEGLGLWTAAIEYARRIGRGNVEAYARVLLAGPGTSVGWQDDDRT